MGIRDTFGFSSRRYAVKQEKCTDRELKKKHHRKCLEIIICSSGVGAGIGAAPFTFGLTLAPAAYSLRQVNILCRQKELIEKECMRRKLPVPRERKRDFAIGLAVGIGSVGLSAAIPIGVHSLAGHAVAGAANTASTAFGSATHHVSMHAHTLATAVNQGGHGLAHGSKETLTSQAHHLARHGTVGVNELYAPLQQLNSGDAAASAAGVGVGALGTMKVESLVGGLVVNSALETTGKKIATPPW